MATTKPNPAAARGSRAALLNTIIVAAGYFLSRVLGIIRDVIITARFGTSAEMDAYQAAFSIPDFLYLVVMGGALGSAFIPVFSRYLAEEQRVEAWRLANAVLNLALLAMVALCVLVAWQADALIGLIFRDFPPEIHALTVDLLRLLLIQPVLLGLGGLAKATLESFERFSLPALGSNLYNIGIIVGALLLAPWLGVYGLVWGVIIGAVLFLLVQLPELWRIGFRYAPNFNLRNPGVLRIAWLMGPRVFGQSAWQLGITITAGIASTVAVGAVTANRLALQLMMLPHGLIALSLGTVIFPQLSRAFAQNDIAGLRKGSLGAVRNVLFLALPAAVVLAVLRYPVIRLLFERGDFTASSTALTSQALLFYAVGLTTFAAAEIIVRTYYAMQNTITPVLVGVFTVFLNIMLAVVFVRDGWGIGGLSLAFSIAVTVEAVLLLLLLWWHWRTLDDFWSVCVRIVVATLAFGGVLLLLLRVSQGWLPFLQPGATYTWPDDFLPLALWTGAALSVSGLVYLGVAWMLRLEEVNLFAARLRRVLRRA